MVRVKTFDATGLAPSGRLYPGDLNAIQDAAAAQNDLTQTIGLGAIQIGETGLQLVRYGAGEARITGAFRTDGNVRVGGSLVFADGSTQTAAAEVDMGLLIALGG